MGLCVLVIFYWKRESPDVFALSLDGSKVAFVEDGGFGTAVLNILKWKAGEGLGAASPVAVTLIFLAHLGQLAQPGFLHCHYFIQRVPHG